MKNNIKLTIENIKSTNDFNYLFELAKKKNFFDDINKYALPTLNLAKIKIHYNDSIHGYSMNIESYAYPYNFKFGKPMDYHD